MSDRPDHSNERPDGPTAPRRLVEGLRAVHGTRVFVPPALDQAILAQARKHLAAVSPPVEERRILRLPRWLAAAAVVAAGLGLALLVLRNERPSLPVAREDIDRNGHVDILDAFALARKLQGGGAADGALDVNGDGVLDQRDVDWIAAQSVKLPRG